MADPIPMERPKLPDHVTNALEVREKMAALVTRTERLRRVLGAPSALPEVKRAAMDDLPMLAAEALALWALR